MIVHTMKKFFVFTALVLFCSPIAAEKLYVEIQSSKLRAAPQHWAKSLADLAYGDALELEAKEGDWLKVNFDGNSGYVHSAAVTKKTVLLKNSGLPSKADLDQGEIVMAGKGFNADIESKHAANDQSLNYEAVDQVEEAKVDTSDIQAFLQEGGLQGSE